MKFAPWIIAITLITSTARSVQAQNLEHLRQLLATRQCMQCDLRGAGLVVANLSGANLVGADLSRANLSRANLSGADLRGANLSGANLNGANLSGAMLGGANVSGADLRDTLLLNSDLTGVNLQGAFIQGAIGIPVSAGTPETFYTWGVNEAARGNYRGAIDFYNQALSLNNQYAPAYLGRAVSRYRLGDERGATRDTEVARDIFTQQKNQEGIEISETFLRGMEAARRPPGEGGGFDILGLIGSLGSALIRLLF